MAVRLSRTAAAVAILTLVGCVVLADASAFLGRDLPTLDLNTGSLLDQLEQVLGASHRVDVERRAGQLEEGLRPTFKALPRDQDDRLEPATLRYLLHRWFVDRHGWYVHGFDTEGEAWNSSLPTTVFGKYAGSEAQGLFEKPLSTRGFSLHEAAVLAATLESFVHMETAQRLHAVYRLLELPSEHERAKESDAALATETYMMMYVLGLNHSTTTHAQIEEQQVFVLSGYPKWAETRKWAREVREEVLNSNPEMRGAFNEELNVVEVIADRFGRWQDQECRQIKESLLKLEQPGTGRVPLATFYEAALNGQWQFSENKAYLRQLGALDETDTLRPSVMISNYVLAPSNCVAASEFYSVCCMNECEALLGYLERQVAAPSAPANRIAEIIAQLPSATVDVPRTLPATLLGRLDEIASQHDGQVPLHGRLFNQWLHHAYPHECPYPHLSGTSKPVPPAKWMQQTGQLYVESQEAMQWHIDQLRSKAKADEEFQDELPWTAEEELFIGRPTIAPEPRATSAAVRGVALVAVACAMSVTSMSLISTAREAVSAAPQLKVSV